LPDTVLELRAFRQGRIFATGWDGTEGREELYLIDADLAEVLQLPDVPRDGGLATSYREMHLTSEWVVVDQNVELEESDDAGGLWAAFFDRPVVRDEVIGYHIPTGSWEVLAQYEPYDVYDTSALESHVAGGDETQVLVKRTSYSPGVLSLEAIDLAAGEARPLVGWSGGTAELALAHTSLWLAGNRLHWIDGNTNELVVRDLEAGQERRIPTVDPISE
jgi:hypothetical protein